MNFKNYEHDNINDNYGIKSEVFNNINKYNLKNQDKKNDINKDIEKQSIIYKDKKYIETWFHDDDIPKPEICEGNSLEFSYFKKLNNNIKKSIESNNSNKNIKNYL